MFDLEFIRCTRADQSDARRVGQLALRAKAGVRHTVSYPSPRRWLLVRREQSVPDSQESLGRWSVDHLFVDQDAVPTLIEVKRSTDTRIRREVVGQMLDYAANGVRYWPTAELQASLVKTQEAMGNDPEAEVRRLLGDPSATLEAFFTSMADNLRAGRIRMVFVADVIPDELMRITEFLNVAASR